MGWQDEIRQSRTPDCKPFLLWHMQLIEHFPDGTVQVKKAFTTKCKDSNNVRSKEKKKAETKIEIEDIDSSENLFG